MKFWQKVSNKRQGHMYLLFKVATFFHVSFMLNFFKFQNDYIFQMN